MRTVEADKNAILALGMQGETGRVQVLFGLSDIRQEYPGGIAAVEVRRPGEDSTYPVTGLEETEDGGIAWTIQNYDVAIRGVGECQLTWAVDGVIVKTKVWKTSVCRSISSDEAEPPTWEDWKTELLQIASEMIDTGRELVEKAEQEADDAEAWANGTRNGDEIQEGDIAYGKTARGYAAQAGESAAFADERAGDANRDALISEGYAVGTQNGEEAQHGEPYHHDNAKWYASCAEQAAGKAGYMYFEIVDGHLIYTRVNTDAADFELRDGHLWLKGVA